MSHAPIHSRISSSLRKHTFCAYCDNCHELVCAAALLHPEDAISLWSSTASRSYILYTHLPPWSLHLGRRNTVYVSWWSGHSEPLIPIFFLTLQEVVMPTVVMSHCYKHFKMTTHHGVEEERHQELLFIVNNKEKNTWLFFKATKVKSAQVS